jgi:hypothetical protein
MGIFDRMFRKNKKPKAKQKARTRRAFGKGKKPEERVSDIPETVVKGKRRPNESRKPTMKKGGKVAKHKAGGKVRGAGKATKGVRPCKMR